MKRRKNNLYIICWQSGHDKQLIVGYLPLYEIPEDSILRDLIFDSNEVAPLENGGLRGIYEKKKYAVEHLRIEKKWRVRPHCEYMKDSDILWIQTIKNP